MFLCIVLHAPVKSVNIVKRSSAVLIKSNRVSIAGPSSSIDSSESGPSASRSSGPADVHSSGSRLKSPRPNKKIV